MRISLPWGQKHMPLKPTSFSFSGGKENKKSPLEGVIYLAKFFFSLESDRKAPLVAVFFRTRMLIILCQSVPASGKINMVIITGKERSNYPNRSFEVC
jgi:hypothetical protein